MGKKHYFPHEEFTIWDNKINKSMGLISRNFSHVKMRTEIQYSCRVERETLPETNNLFYPPQTCLFRWSVLICDSFPSRPSIPSSLHWLQTDLLRLDTQLMDDHVKWHSEWLVTATTVTQGVAGWQHQCQSRQHLHLTS